MFIGVSIPTIKLCLGLDQMPANRLHRYRLLHLHPFLKLELILSSLRKEYTLDPGNVFSKIHDVLNFEGHFRRLYHWIRDL